MGLPTKRLSISDDHSSYRKQSGCTNPYFLPEYDEEDYDSIAEPGSNKTEAAKDSSKSGQKQLGGPLSFKTVAKAITKQRKWSNVLKVTLAVLLLSSIKRGSEFSWRNNLSEQTQPIK